VLESIFAAALVGAGGRVLGLDANEDMLSRAQHNVQLSSADGRADVEFLHAPFDNPTNPALTPYLSQFDVVISNGALCLSFDKPKALQTAFSLLRPGGFFQLFDLCVEDGTVPESLGRWTQNS